MTDTNDLLNMYILALNQLVDTNERNDTRYQSPMLF